jgi:hypothetical protein
LQYPSTDPDHQTVHGCERAECALYEGWLGLVGHVGKISQWTQRSGEDAPDPVLRKKANSKLGNCEGICIHRYYLPSLDQPWTPDAPCLATDLLPVVVGDAVVVYG